MAFNVIGIFVANKQAVGNAIGNVTVKAVTLAILPVTPHCNINPLDNCTYPSVVNDLAISTKLFPLSAANDIVVEPDTVGAANVIEPLVSPEITTEAMIYPYLKIAALQYCGSTDEPASVEVNIGCVVVVFTAPEPLLKLTIIPAQPCPAPAEIVPTQT